MTASRPFKLEEYVKIILFLIMGSVLGACSGSPKKETSASRIGPEEYVSKDPNRAPDAFTPKPKVIDGSEVTPAFVQSQADYYFSMGEAYSLEGNHMKAIEAFRTTLTYDPESFSVALRLGQEYLRIGLVSEALTILLKADKKNPKKPEVKVALGNIHSALKKYEAAIAYYEEALKLDPGNDEVPLYLGALYSELKQYDRAMEFFEKISKSADNQFPHLPYYYMGRVRLEQGGEKNTKSAEAHFQKALSLKSSCIECVLSLGSMHLKNKEDEKAIKIYADYQRKNKPSLRVADILSQLYIERELYDEAYEQFEILEAQSENALNVKLKMALILIEKKIFDKAIAKLNEILAEAPDSDKVRFYLGAVYEETKQNKKAVENFKKIPPESQYFPESSIHAAYLLRGEGELDSAIALMEKALQVKSDHAQMMAMYVSLLDEKGDLKKAAEVLTAGMRQFPENAQLKFYFGTLQDKLGKKEDVISIMKQVIELDPNHVQALNYLAFTWADLGVELDQAEKYARRAVTLEPKDGYILDTLGWILFKKGQKNQSLQYLEAAHRQQPSVAIIAEHLGDVYRALSLSDKAATMYLRAINSETDKGKIEQLKDKLSAVQGQKPLEPRAPASTAFDRGSEQK